jgi:hypothetical protein
MFFKDKFKVSGLMLFKDKFKVSVLMSKVIKKQVCSFLKAGLQLYLFKVI